MGSYGTASQMHPGTSLEGRVALITGAGRGLGAGLARELASRGASVVLNYARSAKAALAVVADIESEGGSAIAIQADISRPAEVAKLFDAAVSHYGHLEIVINNAGMESFANEEDVTEKMFDEVFGLNTRAQFFVAQQGLKHLSRKFHLFGIVTLFKQPRPRN
jgi:NAD(P)-dependent dehydrogenase (short-subunit alcohol dehydrogenase family)